MKVLKAELKIVLRRPIWLIFIAFVAWTGVHSAISDSNFGLDFPLFELMRRISSLGDWGRGMLQNISTFYSIFFSLFVAFIAATVFSVEFRHQDVLWSTPGGGTLKLSLIRLAILSSWIALLVLMGASVFFLSSSDREILALAGWPYLPLYIALVWLHIAVWVALTMLFFEFTRSRAWTSFAVMAIQALWFWTTIIGTGRGSFVQLFHRNLVSWNFFSPFNPLGVIPIVFFLQVAMVRGFVLTLIGIVHL